jgi:hypothetical protein
VGSRDDAAYPLDSDSHCLGFYSNLVSHFHAILYGCLILVPVSYSEHSSFTYFIYSFSYLVSHLSFISAFVHSLVRLLFLCFFLSFSLSSCTLVIFSKRCTYTTVQVHKHEGITWGIWHGNGGDRGHHLQLLAAFWSTIVSDALKLKPIHS